MWLLTNGKNSGVCKLIGDAIKMEKERRHVLASNYSRNIITTSKLEKLPKITAIGIVPISQLTYGDDFEVCTQEVKYCSPPLIRPLPPKDTPSSLTRFQIHRDSKILLNFPPIPLQEGDYRGTVPQR